MYNLIKKTSKIMKKIYMKPEVFVVKIATEFIAVSGPKVITPGGENPPASQDAGMDTKGRGDYGSDSNFGDLW